MIYDIKNISIHWGGEGNRAVKIKSFKKLRKNPCNFTKNDII